MRRADSALGIPAVFGFSGAGPVVVVVEARTEGIMSAVKTSAKTVATRS